MVLGRDSFSTTSKESLCKLLITANLENKYLVRFIYTQNEKAENFYTRFIFILFASYLYLKPLSRILNIVMIFIMHEFQSSFSRVSELGTMERMIVHSVNTGDQVIKAPSLHLINEPEANIFETETCYNGTKK